jgi:hypothetical protein
MVKGRHKAMRLTIRWVPGHERVAGNEGADSLAKLAITEGSSKKRELPVPLREGLPVSKFTLWRKARRGLEKKATAVWRRSPRYEKIRRVDNSMPSKNFLKLVDGLPRQKASLIFQLHAGHVPLHAHLFRITRVDSPKCEGFKDADETVHHFLMRCPMFAEERQHMVNEGG